MKAINDGDKSHAQELLESAIKANTTFKIVCEEITKPKPEPDFSLEVFIEFQQPQKNPLTIYLYNIRESFTVFDLQTMVEKQFYIPRSSQNWIIGPKLIKNDDKQPLKEHGLAHTKSGDSQKVFLYVMHTKKANVAKEDLEGIQSRQRAQQKQQLSEVSAPLPPEGQPPRNQQFQQGQRANYPPGGQNVMGPVQGSVAGDPNQSAYPQGRQDQDYGRARPPPGSGMGQPYGRMDDPTYDRIGHRGYNPGFTDDGLPKFRVNQDPPPMSQYPPQGANEPLYERINNQGRPAELDMRNPPLQGGRKYPPGGIPLLPPSGGKPPPRGVGVFPNMMPRGQSAPNSQAVLGFPAQLNPAPVPEPPREPEGWKCPGCT